MTQDIQAAAERYARDLSVPFRESPYYDMGGVEQRNTDANKLAAYLLSLGERQADRLSIYKGSEHYCGPFENPDTAYETVEAYGDEFRLVRVTTFLSPVDDDTTKGTANV